MANTGNTQQQIDYGAAANDGTGDPLRTAFIKTDDNFDNIWSAGPVGSNITIINNTVQANDTNGNLILSPNGIGVVQTNSKLLPRLNNTYDLGSTALKYRAGYFGTGGLTVDGNVSITGNLTAGNISYTSNVFVGDLEGSVFADDSTVMVDAIDNVLYAGRAAISGNVSATYFIGNGSQLTGMAATYGNANVVANLAALGSNPVSTTGNVSANYFVGNGSLLTGIVSSYGNANVVANLAALGSNPVSTTGNVSANYFVGNGSLLTGMAATYGNANVVANLAALGSNPVSTTGNVSANYFVGNGSLLTGMAATYGNANVATFLAAFGSNTIVTTGNITGGNLITAGSGGAITMTGGNITGAGNIAAGNVSTTGNITGNYILGNGSQLTGLPATYGNANVVANLAALGSNPVSTTGNITGGNILGGANVNATTHTGTTVSVSANVTGGNILTGGLISATGNITGGNISVTSYTGTTVSVTGNVTTSGNVAANSFVGNGATLSNVATTFESAWTVPTGNSTQSFTVTASNTYLMWVDCNIANGILAWNATATVTNTNVPVVGAQYAWVYTGGGTPIDFTSIPDQFVGTSNTIVRSSVSPSATTNRFDFGINNTSGNTVTVRYGWAQIS